MDRRHFIAGGMAFWAAAPGLAVAQPGWMLLGSRSVNWAGGRDSIMVARRGPISALSFISRGGEIFLTRVEVTFGRGRVQRMPVNMRLRPNLRSPIVRLRSTSDIRHVDFWYRRPSGRPPRTILDVFGRR